MRVSVGKTLLSGLSLLVSLLPMLEFSLLLCFFTAKLALAKGREASPRPLHSLVEHASRRVNWGPIHLSPFSTPVDFPLLSCKLGISEKVCYILLNVFRHFAVEQFADYLRWDISRNRRQFHISYSFRINLLGTQACINYVLLSHHLFLICYQIQTIKTNLAYLSNCSPI